MKTLIYFFIVSTLLLSCSENKTVKWRLQSHAGKSSIDFKELITLSENIKKMSNGTFVIEVYSGGEIAGGAKIFEAVRSGEVEMGNGWPNWWSAQHPSWAVMNAGPFDFMNLDASMMFFLAGEGTELANELAGKVGLVWRPAWWPGMEFGLLSREPIKGLSDLKGKRVRIGPGLPSEVMSDAAESLSIPLVPNEIHPSLESGVIDAVEWTTANGVLDLGLEELAPNAIVPAIWQPSVLSDFLINEKSLNKLSDSHRTILETAIKAYTLTTTLKSKVKDMESLESLKSKGVVFNKWSPSDLEKWRKSSDKIYNEYKKKDDFSKRLINSKQQFKSEYNRYYELFKSYE